MSKNALQPDSIEFLREFSLCKVSDYFYSLVKTNVYEEENAIDALRSLLLFHFILIIRQIIT